MSLTPKQAKELAEQLLHDADTAPGAEVAPLPESIGSYRIRRRIASGGMGTVYEAEQPHPHRIVALKVMKHGIASRAALRRFEYEAEILGRLCHPGIAQIYEAGTHDDGSGLVPFFAMEYVPDARSIIEHADAENLPVRERLDLFARVCDAVHHGHQKGVIHRDIKPGNILVDEFGRPKVIDFGVARTTDADVAVTTTQTSVGELLGTLQYMSPEQCEANPDELDTRTDVYSLGVVLYELVCGQPPYDVSNAPLPGATRIIQERAPSRPSTVRRTCRGDIETITLRALEKAPDNRYQSAAQLAQDIRRHLSGQPIESQATRPWMRVLRWAGRHPIVTTAIACVTIALVTLGLTAMSLWWLRLRPYRIDITVDEREAMLVSFGGAVLHTWSGGADGAIVFARLMEQPQALGGRQIAVIGYSAAAQVELKRSLCAFALSDLDTPLWTARITDSDISRSPLPASFTEEQFQVTCAVAADIFPERPGREIAAIHKDGASSPVSLCVYDLSGERLYMIWHDGPLGPVYWLAPEHLMVTCGLSHEAPWARQYFDETGYKPIVVLALDPEVGHLATRWTGVSAEADATTLAWYECLMPPDLSAEFSGGSVKEPHSDEDKNRFMRFDLHLRNEREATVSWLMTGSGELLPNSPVRSDRYRRRQQRGLAPAPAQLSLVDAPPSLPQAE